MIRPPATQRARRELADRCQEAAAKLRGIAGDLASAGDLAEHPDRLYALSGEVGGIGRDLARHLESNPLRDRLRVFTGRLRVVAGSRS